MSGKQNENSPKDILTKDYQRLVYVQKDRSIERLVFSSGGAKGAAYPGVLKALELTHVLPGVEKVVGTSAGAIIASLIAAGIDTRVLYEDFRKTNFVELLGNRVGTFFGENKEGVSFFSKDGKNFLEHMRLLINDSIYSFLSSERAKEYAHDHRQQALAQRVKDKKIITYGDLAILHQLYPDKFKDLTVISVLFPSGEVRVFNSHETPEVEIAQSVRASSSIPGVFEPFLITYKHKLELHSDGALFELLPSNYFDRDIHGNYTENQKPEKTLLFSFADNATYEKSSVFKAMHSTRTDEEAIKIRYEDPSPISEARFFQPNFFEKLVRNTFVDYIGGVKAPYTHPERWDRAFHSIYERYHHNTVAIGNGEISNLNFPAATTWAKEISAIGFLDTMNYLIAHELYDMKKFNAQKYYDDLMNIFERIYMSMLRQFNILHTDEFRNNFQNFEKKLRQEIKNKSALNEQCIYFIRDYIRENLDSLPAFALSMAADKVNGFVEDLGINEAIANKIKESWF